MLTGTDSDRVCRFLRIVYYRVSIVYNRVSAQRGDNSRSVTSGKRAKGNRVRCGSLVTGELTIVVGVRWSQRQPVNSAALNVWRKTPRGATGQEA